MHLSHIARIVALAGGMSAVSAMRASGQDAAWNDPRTRALVELATHRRAQQIADTMLVDYQADARGFVTFLAQIGKGFIEIPKIVKVDQIAAEVYWHAPNLSKQRIIGRRDSTILPTDIQYHRDHLGIVQNNFPDIIRLGDGDEVRDVPHPLSAVGLQEYDFQVADSLRIHLPDREIFVMEVRVRPKNDRMARVIGAVYIDPSEGQVVRMAFSFTRGAFLDKSLEDLSIVLDNGLVGTRFWLPYRQEIEIRRTGTYLDFPFRGIIRGRWEIDNYHFNLAQPASRFTGSEFTTAPPETLRQYKWEGNILDALPPDVRMATNEEVRHVQEEARALVRQAALERPQHVVLSAPGLSRFARVNRVEGLAVGTGVTIRPGHALALSADGRFGFSDHRAKGTMSLAFERPSGSSVRLYATHDSRDAGDVAERSTAMNSFASQEFASDFTDPFSVTGGGIAMERHAPGTLDWVVDLSTERQRPLTVHARPVSGTFVAPVAADSLDAVRLSASVERAAAPWHLGFTLGARLEARVQRSRLSLSTDKTTARVFGNAELKRHMGASTLRLWTGGGLAVAKGGDGSGYPSAQDFLYFGGPVTAPGYAYHSLPGQAAISQRVELQHPVPFPRIRLGRFGSTPSTATLAPYLHVAALGLLACSSEDISSGTSSGATQAVIPAGRSESRDLRSPQSDGSRLPLPSINHCDAPGWRPSAGVALIAFYDLLRVDVARGLRQGIWTLNVDVSTDFWKIL